jgi:hypothetical protein
MSDFPLAFSDMADDAQEQGALARFRRALRRGDQRVLDDLLKSVSPWAGQALPAELLAELPLLLALLEEQRSLAEILEELQGPSTLQIGDG